MPAKQETHQKITLRRAIVSSAFTMLLLLAVVGLFSLFSIWSISRAWTAGAAETAELQGLSRAALDAQVTFKVQVQEWKNVLLRGEDAALLATYLASFRAHGTQAASQLARVAGEAGRLGFPAHAAEARTLAEAHRSLTARYEATLRQGMASAASLDAQAARLIDKSLRGADRGLEGSIGKLATELAAVSEDRRGSLSARMQARYLTLRWFIIGVIALSLAITGFAVSGALRATRS